MNKPNLSVTIAGVKFKNPVIAASGCFGYGQEYAEIFDINKLGGFVVKGISLKPQQGNKTPRIVETPSGMLNAIGLQNVGLEVFIKEKLPFLKKLDTNVIVNIYGKKIEEYAELAEKISGEKGISFLEVNISCPNVEKGGMAFGHDPEVVYKLVKEVKKRSKIPVIVKLSPNTDKITEIAKSAEDAGADAVSLINTILGMAIDIEKRKPVLANITGGLSGPAIKPVALRMVWQVAQTVKIPVIGMGGITDCSGALEFIIAGAAAVQVGTANFINPLVTLEVIEGIGSYLKKHKLRNISSLTIQKTA
ncbi:MAG: dihydroorotate dehydrogenase [bacterium]|nr:dihydroorotate dehydrogenase [bacterium]